jgi:chemotaxis signal transduction protein
MPGEVSGVPLVTLEQVLGVPAQSDGETRVLLIADEDRRVGLVVAGRLDTIRAHSAQRLPLPPLVAAHPFVTDLLTNETGPRAIVLDGRRLARELSARDEGNVRTEPSVVSEPAAAPHSNSTIDDSQKEPS